jgi:hypothetical protein
MVPAIPCFGCLKVSNVQVDGSYSDSVIFK